MTSLHCISQDPIPQYRRQWIGLLTVPNQEQKAANWLVRIADRSPTQVYWPRKIVQAPAKVLPNGRKGRQPQARPIIYGMVFASIVMDEIEDYQPFAHFNATPGIRGWLRNERRAPRYISDAEMGMVRDMEVRANTDEVPAVGRELKLGDSVLVTSDTLNGSLRGIVTRLNGDSSVNVDVQFLGATMKFVLEQHQVEAV